MPDEAMQWIELRVHGVSGTPVEKMLSVEKGRTKRVLPADGDDDDVVAGFHQRTDATGAVVGADENGRILEAYHWGEYTEGRPGQGLWVALIPFGVVNAAQFMLPAATAGTRWAHAIAGACLRIVALVLTGLAVLGTAYVAMDRLAWRAMGSEGSVRWWAISVAALVPIAVLAWLRRVGSVKGTPDQSDLGMNPAEDFDPVVPDRHAAWGAPPSDGAMSEAPGGLGSSYFYVGSPLTPARTDAPTLRNLHLAAAVGLVAVLLAWPTASADDAFGQAVRAIGLAFLGVLAGVVVFLGDPEELASPHGAAGAWRTARRWWHLIMFHAAPWILGVAGVVLLAAEVAVVRAAIVDVAVAAPPTDALPGINGTAFVMLVAALSAVLLMGVMGVILGAGAADERERFYRRYALGTTGTLAAAVGLFLGIAYTAGFVAVADILINVIVIVIGCISGRPDGAVASWVALPNVVRHIEFAWILTFLLTVLIAVSLVIRYRLQKSRLRRAAVRDFARVEAGAVELADPVVDHMVKRMYVARLKNFIPHAFVFYAVTGIGLTIAAGLDLQGAVSWLGLVPCVDGWVAAGAFVLVGLTAFIVWVAKKSQASLGARRSANTVWDVISFWPRSVHPFVPVAYSQFVVAELRRRISHHLDDHRPVVLAGHSQGSLIALAALSWIPPDQRSGVGVLTFGSQIRQMFSRAFPAYVNTAVMMWVWDSFGKRWRNLYRDTDHLAGPVLSWRHETTQGSGDSSGHWPAQPGPPNPVSDTFVALTGTRECGPDWRLLDPRVAIDDGTAIVPDPNPTTLHCHSDYWTDPAWRRAVEKVRP